MNFKHKRYTWGGHEYLQVGKKRFENFVRYFRDKIEGNGFMGWLDFYDWSLNGNLEITKETPEKIVWDNLEKCMVARKYVDSPEMEYWIRVDYCDLKSIPYVPKPRPKRLTKEEKKFIDFFCEAFDNVFRECAMQESLTGSICIPKCNDNLPRVSIPKKMLRRDLRR